MAKSQKAAKANAIKLAKIISKTRQNYECEKCDKTLAQGWQMHGAHIMPVTWAKTAAMPENILCLCAACHSMGSNSQHQDPIPFSRWFDDKWPGRYDELRKLAVDYSQNPKPKIDWVEVLDGLKQQAEELGIK